MIVTFRGKNLIDGGIILIFRPKELNYQCRTKLLGVETLNLSQKGKILGVRTFIKKNYLCHLLIE